MKTFISKLLEKADFLVEDSREWNWTPEQKIDLANASSSTTCCGRTRTYDGSSDMGADDTDND